MLGREKAFELKCWINFVAFHCLLHNNFACFPFNLICIKQSVKSLNCFMLSFEYVFAPHHRYVFCFGHNFSCCFWAFGETESDVNWFFHFGFFFFFEYIALNFYSINAKAKKEKTGKRDAARPTTLSEWRRIKSFWIRKKSTRNNIS